MPQLLLSVCKLTQVETELVPVMVLTPQIVWGKVHVSVWHVPAWQVWPKAQTLPHAPQLLESVERLVQVRPAEDEHAVSPELHVALHRPSTQPVAVPLITVAEQILPHAPQL